LNIGKYINCYTQLEAEGYYLDNNLFKKCYLTCKTCDKEGNSSIHNCIKCNENLPFKIKENNYSNCYKNCNYYHYIDDENNLICTLNDSCPEEYPKLINNS